MRPRFKGISLGLALTAVTVAAAAPAVAADPFATEVLAADAAGTSLARPLESPGSRRLQPCQWQPQAAPLSLAEVVDRALCNNPQTREAWANARFQAAQVGVAQSAYLPSASLSLSSSVNTASGSSSAPQGMVSGEPSYNQTSATLALNYLLYDFGGRAAALETARQLMTAVNASQDAMLQSVFLATVQAYYQWYAAQALVAAARESERVSQESLKAAQYRYQVGTATPADQLQARTAVSQATLVRIRAEGDVSSAQGGLANAMGLPADQVIAVAPPAQALPDLIAAAKRLRPDLAAAEAQVLAAKAGIDAARATGMPSLALYANSSDMRNSAFGPTRGNALGIAINIPIFTGFNTTYQIRAAEAQVDVKAAQRDRIALQVALDVWRAYNALVTESQAVRAAADLLASAEASEKVAQGRYRAGVGGILDLLSAQSALASARQQHIQELYNWRLARVSLAQAIGQLDFAALASVAK